ncbi:MAG: LysR family transcriptional regulator [Steroidobacteraceae bacterium]
MYYEPVVHKKKTAPAPAISSLHLPSLVTFECVARHLNFSRAAAELRVTPTAVSKTIKQLEGQVGIRLFHRTTRSVSLSESGALLLSTLGPALEQIRDSVSSVSGTFTQPYGALRINSSYVAYASLMEPNLPTFLARHPQISVEVSLDNNLSDIVANGFDAGIRLGHALNRDMVAVPIGPVQRRLVVASPQFLSSVQAPDAPQDLLGYPCIRQRLAGKGRFFEWAFHARRQAITVDVQGPLIFDEMRSVLNAARLGCGFAYVFEQFAASELRRGDVVPVLERFSPATEAFYLYYPARTLMSGKLRAFLEFMRAANWKAPR